MHPAPYLIGPESSTNNIDQATVAATPPNNSARPKPTNARLI
jgi:hypothetical protein